MKKNSILFAIMCIGMCMIESSGAAFVVALAMVLVPAAIMLVGELYKNSANVSADICEDVLVDYATRNDMEEQLK